MNRISKKLLLGMGLDSKDGHIRITTGKNFKLFGGSKRTHDMMTRQVLKFNRELDKIQKTLDDISEREFVELARAAGIIMAKKKKTGGVKDVKDNDR